MNSILATWNELDGDSAVTELLSCCAAKRWADAVVARRPFDSEQSLYAVADHAWAAMQESDWMEAFAAHPRIGERKAQNASTRSTAWSAQEQSEAEKAKSEVMNQLALSNKQYEELFGFTYIICATGKSAEEMLHILHRRLASDRQAELAEAAEQQRQITQIRLRKWLEA